MTLETARAFFGWCGWMRKLHGRWFRLPAAHFDAFHYAGIGLYKLGILLFCLVPWLALLIVT